jgi:hypothetical protein
VNPLLAVRPNSTRDGRKRSSILRNPKKVVRL